MERLFAKRKPLAVINSEPVVERRLRRAASFLKCGVDFKRLSVCSWDNFDIETIGKSESEVKKVQLPTVPFQLVLEPYEGSGAVGCVQTWDVTLMQKIPGKTRKCKINPIRPRETPAISARITINESSLYIWGSVKNEPDFEIVLPLNGINYGTCYGPIGTMKRGSKSKGKRAAFEHTHNVFIRLPYEWTTFFSTRLR